MKHLLNNLSEEEKNSIRAQHIMENINFESFTVPTLPKKISACGESGIKEMKSAWNAKAITHMIPLIPGANRHVILFNTKKQYCAATIDELKQIIG
jgi:hypothetical protein